MLKYLVNFFWLKNVKLWLISHILADLSLKEHRHRLHTFRSRYVMWYLHVYVAVVTKLSKHLFGFCVNVRSYG